MAASLVSRRRDRYRLAASLRGRALPRGPRQPRKGAAGRKNRLGLAFAPMFEVAAAACATLLGALAYLAYYLRWLGRLTRGNAYFGRTLAERRAIKQAIARRHRLGRLLLAAAGYLGGRRRVPAAWFAGISAPRLKCTRRTLERAFYFRPTARDVIVATQMKCGTTWMQQIVYEILMHGRGDLSDTGHRHICAVSPWIESFDNVSIDEAPLLGPSQRRVIKTHFPASLCPYSPEAKYVYVTRHPASCFASTADFAKLLGGPLCPSRERLLELFCSRRMWWGPWPAHVAGWWEWSRRYPNVLFLHFEEMRDDLREAVRRVARFLEEPLSPEELDRVVAKADYAYMKAHEEAFEMSPPTPFSVAGDFMKSGRRDRYRDASPAERRRIIEYCRAELAGSSYPAARFYPELAPAPLAAGAQRARAL
ncbi:MAG: sulfotransferase domain-containing protein [Candidatus Dadabacteria bacterium]|nr:MAG: sulfotransferase domain-containing protein [Candidatus Dadabacteria bacterium]